MTRPLMKNWSPPQKARNLTVTKQFLDARVACVEAAGYSKQKWVEYCEAMMALGLRLTLYEAQKTFSKYITVSNGVDDRRFVVRFSNHKPIKHREMAGDCDFFVGISHLQTTTTKQAIEATTVFFAAKEQATS